MAPNRGPVHDQALLKQVYRKPSITPRDSTLPLRLLHTKTVLYLEPPSSSHSWLRQSHVNFAETRTIQFDTKKTEQCGILVSGFMGYAWQPRCTRPCLTPGYGSISSGPYVTCQLPLRCELVHTEDRFSSTNYYSSDCYCSHLNTTLNFQTPE